MARNFSTSYNLLAKSIKKQTVSLSQEILNALSEKIAFLMNFCHLFPIFFMSETQVLMTVPNLFGFFSRNHFLEGALLFNGKGFILSGGCTMGEINFDGVGFKKNHGMGGGGRGTIKIL